jgi:hypothetical protein
MQRAQRDIDSILPAFAAALAVEEVQHGFDDGSDVGIEGAIVTLAPPSTKANAAAAAVVGMCVRAGLAWV